jgi:hypothetical protein
MLVLPGKTKFTLLHKSEKIGIQKLGSNTPIQTYNQRCGSATFNADSDPDKIFFNI